MPKADTKATKKKASAPTAKAVKPAAVKRATPAKRAEPSSKVAKKAAPAKAANGKKAAVTTKASSPSKAPASKVAKKATPVKKAPVAKPVAKKTAPPRKPEKAATKVVPAKAEPKKAVKKAEPPKKAPPRKSTVICPLSGFEVKPDRPGLAPSTIERLRVKLLDERERHTSQAEALQAEAHQLAIDRDEGDTQFDEEGGEGDTVSVERERDLMLSASARQTVDEIDRALERIRNHTYGLCVPAGRRISVERLEALPYAETCVDCKARAERRR
ncbi:MAG TPA: TraR/DksA C4-type zinc finger protein [Acidimicrobiia bacterium]|jgi:RNA polymerase-binding transcription factor DksA